MCISPIMWKSRTYKFIWTLKFVGFAFFVFIIYLHVKEFCRTNYYLQDEFNDHKLNLYSPNSILLRSHTIWYSYLSKLTDSRSQQLYNLWSLSYKPTTKSPNFKQKLLPKYDFFEATIYANSTIQSSEGFFNCGHLYNITTGSKQHKSISLLVFNTCVTGFESTTFKNIYTYYDRMIKYIEKITREYPNTILIWSLPSFPNEMSSELVLLHHHLITTVLIKLYALVVMQTRSLPAGLGEKQHISHLIRQFIQIYCDISPSDFSINNKFAINEQYLSLILYSVHNYILQIRVDGSKSMNNNYNHNNYTTVQRQQKTLQSMCGKYLYTRKYDAFCMPRLQNIYPVLITGLGGSGTHFLTNKLRSAGFKFYHEDVAQDGSVVRCEVKRYYLIDSAIHLLNLYVYF